MWQTKDRQENTTPQPILFIKNCSITFILLFHFYFNFVSIFVAWNYQFSGKTIFILIFFYSNLCGHMNLTRMFRIDIKWFQLTSSISTSFCVINSVRDGIFTESGWKKNCVCVQLFAGFETQSNERQIMKHLNYPLSWLIIFIRRICYFFSLGKFHSLEYFILV